MKKVFYSLCAIVACTCVWVACSDDDSFEKSREQTNKERLEEIIQKYDVNFVLNDSILSTDISDAELAEFEELIKTLSGIRGTYKLHADSVGDSTYLAMQMKKHQRSRRLAMTNEVVEYGTYNYDDETVADLRYPASLYTCKCSVQWKKVNNHMQWVKVFPEIDFDVFNRYYGHLNIEMWDNNYDVFITSDSTFRFIGRTRGEIIGNSTYADYGYIRLFYEGSYRTDYCFIDWDYRDSYIDTLSIKNDSIQIFNK